MFFSTKQSIQFVKLRNRINFRIFCFSILFVACLSAQIYAQSSFENETKVEQSLLEEDWPKIANLLEQVTPETTSPIARMIKGHAALALNRNNESLCLFLSVVTGDNLQTASALQEWQDWTSGYVQKHPEKAIAFYLYGDALARNNQWNEAIHAFTKALRFNPNHALALNARGVTYAAKKELGKSRIDFEKAMNVNISLADTYANIGCRLIQKQEGAKGAIKYFDDAIRLSPHFSLALHSRGCLNLVIQKWEFAERDFDAAEKSALCAKELIAENILNVTAYLGGQTKEELLAILKGEKSGTTFDVKFNYVQSAWNNYKSNPNQFNFNRFNEKYGALAPTQQTQFFNKTIKNDLGKSIDFDRYQKDLGNSFDWNNKGRADMWTNMIQRLSVGVAVLNPDPVTKGIAIGAAAGMEQLKQWTKVNSLGAGKQMDLLNQNFNKLPKPGGVDISLASALWEDGNWPFVAFYGLLYNLESISIGNNLSNIGVKHENR